MDRLRRLMDTRRGTVGFAAGLLTALVLGGGVVALAAIPSTANGSYTACVSKRTGAVRIVDAQAGRHCTTGERTISWSKGYRYRGAWNARTTYAVLDVVTYEGSSYLARTASTGKSPAATAAAWGLLAAAGHNGVAGLGASVFSDDAALTPPTDGTLSVVKQVQITTTRPGKLVIVTAHVYGVGFNNTAPTPVSYISGVYVDGAGVPGTGSIKPGQVPAMSGAFTSGAFDLGPGTIAGIPAGTHTVAIEVRTTDTTVDYTTGGSAKLLVIATD